MTNATLAGVRKGQREQVAAIKRAMEVFGEPLQLTASSSNRRDFVSFEAYAKDSVWAEHATSVYVNVEALSEYGRPKAISPKMWVWGSSFVRVSLHASYPFNIYWLEPGSTDSEGNHTKAHLRPFAIRVSVEGGRSYGLGEWSKHRETLTQWASKFVNDSARKALLDGVDTADRYIAEWRDGIAAMAKSAEGVPMIVLDVQQGTQEWVAARLGIPTASRFSDIITPKTRKASASQGRYMCELVAERLTGFPANDASSDFMQRGSAMEAEAAAAYEFDTQSVTAKVGFCLDDSRSWGCSPDRFVGEDGILEIKCLGVANHVMAVLGMKDADHGAQVQGQLWITGRKWVDLYYFNPAIVTHRVRIERDEEFIAALDAGVRAFCERLDEAHAMITGGQGATVAPTDSKAAPAGVAS